ncbi:metal ABC transporter ATP-binding protein [Deinococcus lacus]|uniref:Metal ABC transporter ATP-binding protein n=1 Tax=Deinococcus lacus TaxID=392561 RepID=A0ABW1YD66_9DEIO
MTHLACTPECYAPDALQVQNLTVRYGQHTALEEANVTFHLGELSAIIGPNGAGKSTLLKAILGLTPDVHGEVTFGGRQDVRRHTAYVPQQQTLDWAFPVTVWDVAMMGRTGRLGWLRWPGRADRERVKAALEQAGVYDLRQRHIGELSGGQRQRVLLARMLVRDAAVLLLDEPLTGVDQATSAQLLSLLRGQAEQGRAVVMVTHDLEQAREWCDHLTLINRRIIADGTPQQVYTPHNIEATFSRSALAYGHQEA